MRIRSLAMPIAIVFSLVLACSTGLGAEQVKRVADDTALRAALRQARPGTRILIAAGRYAPGVFLRDMHGTAAAPTVIEGEDPKNPPVFEGGGTAWQLSDCSYLTLRNLSVRGQRHNGINIDDGGTFDTPAHHLVLEDLRVAEIGPSGNFDGIKLSGVDDFVVRGCTVEGWGGQAVDMVGCHRGVIEGCTFRGRKGFSQHTGPQAKGGSSDITIRRCLFVEAGGRAVQMGGSTGMAYFRPPGARYEAKNIRVEGCVFVGSDAPVAFTGADSSVFRYNTIYRPTRWILRILQETTAPGFVPCRRGRFEHNLIIFRRSELSTWVNIGPNTQPESFVFARNWWFCEDRPETSKPVLPATETGGVYGIDPKLADPQRNRFEPQNAQAAAFGASAWQPDQ